jgi:hypothetical protein
MDFTLSKYTELLKSLKAAGYTFVTFHDYLTSINPKPQAPSHNPEPEISLSCQKAAVSRDTAQNKESRYPAKKRQSHETQQGTTNQEQRNKEQGTRNLVILPKNGSLTRHSKEQGTLNSERLVILRHDVDLKPQNSLATAKIEHGLGIKGSYYFRMVPESFNVDIIKEIVSLGHEIGYHYETMDTAGKCLSKTNRSPIVIASEERTKQSFREEILADCLESKESSNEPENKECFANNARNDEMRIDAAYQQFCENLETLRKIADIKTVCMHGSPRSKFDNREIWTKYSYRDLGVIGEPYFDVDFNNFFYLTDTGRCWNGHRFSVRDKMPQQQQWDREGLSFKATKDIIQAISNERLPQRIMITVHPQRWSSSVLEWAKELVLQNLKNVVKRIMVIRSK